MASCAQAHSCAGRRQIASRGIQPSAGLGHCYTAKATKGKIMGTHRSVSTSSADRKRLCGGLFIGTLASGAVAVCAPSSAGDANATCVSAGGWFTVGSGCTTSAPGDFALAIGEGAVATATGGGNLAVSWGVGASATAVGKNNTA